MTREERQYRMKEQKRHYTIFTKSRRGRKAAKMNQRNGVRYQAMWIRLMGGPFEELN